MLVLMMRARESNYSEEVDVIVPQYAEKIAAKPGVEEAESSCG